MKVSEIGEFGLIERLAGLANKTANVKSGQELIIGIGDDTAAYLAGNRLQLATVDSMVQDIHFSLEYTNWKELGWKSLAVNLSDIAAMGGIPAYALISLGLPDSTEVEDVVSYYSGMMEIAKKFDTVIVGGDTVRSPVLFVSITVLGSAMSESRILRRSSAKPGDKIAVTNYLGASAAGLEMLTKKLKFNVKNTAQLRKAHLKPSPRVVEGQLLMKNGVRCGMDISDGLVGDLTHICQESQVGACINVDLVPIAPVVKSCFGKRAMELALTGGEDYELLFTASARTMKKVKTEIECPVTVIGEITAENIGKVTLIDNYGKPVILGKMGWDHFPDMKTPPLKKGE